MSYAIIAKANNRNKRIYCQILEGTSVGYLQTLASEDDQDLVARFSQTLFPSGISF